MIIRASGSRGNRLRGVMKEYTAKPNITECLTIKGIKDSYLVKTNIPTHLRQSDSDKSFRLEYDGNEFAVAFVTRINSESNVINREAILTRLGNDEPSFSFMIDAYNTRNISWEVITNSICRNP